MLKMMMMFLVTMIPPSVSIFFMNVQRAICNKLAMISIECYMGASR